MTPSHRGFVAFGVAMALCSAPLQAHAAAPAPTEAASSDGGAKKTDPVRAELVIDADLGDASAVLLERMRVRGEALLRRHEVLPARGDADPKIRIHIEPIGDEPGYRCKFGVYDETGVVAQSDGTSLCKLCTEAELVDHVEAAIDRVVPKLPVHESTEVPPPRVDPGADGGGRAAPLGGLGKAGIGVMVLGVAAGVAGAVVFTRKTKVENDELVREETSYRTPGIAVLSAGVAVLVAGVTMLAVDRARAKRRGAVAWRGGAGRF